MIEELFKMNPLLCFCHFCELHGPNVILTTHCLSKTDLISYIDQKIPNNCQTSCSLASSMSSLPTNSLITDNSNLFNNEIHLISDEMNGQSNGCDGCSLKSKSMVGFNGFLSFNDNKKFGFITNSYPIERNDWNSCGISNAIIRDACIRSLSCEVYDGGEGEGPIYFGDDQRAHILSYLFVLRDSKARGFQRTYSILVMSRDKQQLLNDWDFYVKHIQQIVVRLKNKAKIIYESELTQTTCQQRRSLILDNVSGLKSNVTSIEDIIERNPLTTQRTNTKARSLLELTADNTTFASLHIQLSYILFAINSQNESIPVLSSNESYCPTINSFDPNHSLRDLYKFVGKDRFEAIGYNAVIGNQIIVIDENISRLKSFIQCLSQLLPEECLLIGTDFHNFEESAKHNIIGILSSDLLPKNLFDSEFHAIIKLKDKTNDKTNDKTSQLFSEKTHISVNSNIRIPDRIPNYLTNVVNILLDFSYSDQTFSSYLTTLKNEWLNKSQALYSFTKGVNPPRSQSDIISMIRLIGCEECDLKVLIFLSNSGLKFEFKSKVFSINSETNL